MQSEVNAVDRLLTQLAQLLGPLSPFTKAVVPAALSLAQLLVALVLTGSASTVSLTLAIGGVVLSALVYFLPNVARKPAVTAPAAKQ